MAFRGRLGGRRITVAMLRGRTSRVVGPGRPSPPTRTAFGPRAGRIPWTYHRRMARGGFFKSIFKGVSKVVKSVTKIPVIGTVAKAAVSSLPIVGQVQTAIGAFKKKTPVGVAASPVGGVVSPSQMANIAANRKPARRRKAKKAKKAKRRTKRAKSKRSGGGSAKQRAARARFAAAARKGRIKKGQRL